MGHWILKIIYKMITLSWLSKKGCFIINISMICYDGSKISCRGFHQGWYLIFKICQISLFGKVFLHIRHHSRSGNEQKLKIVISMPPWKKPNLNLMLYQFFAENSKNIIFSKKNHWWHYFSILNSTSFELSYTSVA